MNDANFVGPHLPTPKAVEMLDLADQAQAVCRVLAELIQGLEDVRPDLLTNVPEFLRVAPQLLRALADRAADEEQVTLLDRALLVQATCMEVIEPPPKPRRRNSARLG